MVGHFREMKSRRYSRGQLTPSQGYHPEVLELFVRRAQKKLTPL
jgi:hypothetical protein